MREPHIATHEMGRFPWVARLTLLVAALCTGPAPRYGGAAPGDFRRGDSNNDGTLDLSDALRTFYALFMGGDPLTCLDAADSNDSGEVDLSDGIHSLLFLFVGGSPPPAPGYLNCGPDPTADLLTCDFYPEATCGEVVPPTLREIGHVLNRLGYGPSQASADRIRQLGITSYIHEQLYPASIDESANSAFNSRWDALFDETIPKKDRSVVAAGEIWSYFKGTVAPPSNWNVLAFDDSTWLKGPTGIGAGDDDDATVLADMLNSYASVYLRKTFSIADVSLIHDLVLRVDYDDGFVAYLNGTEVARKGLSGSPPPHTALASSHEAGEPEEFDISAALLEAGPNLLAIQVHNARLDSPDLSMIPVLIDREILPLPPRRQIRGVSQLQEVVHVRGVYSEKQLQAALGEFWENHFTTDLDKVAEYFDKLQDSDASDAMDSNQARFEAAQAEYAENQFFFDHALDNFGDLLLYSATSPTMLIYLDSVLNVVGAANENYAREILELHAFGVDNRYVQKDIEQLAKCFTGWTLCKVPYESAPAFPQSAINPPAECGVQFEDAPIVDLGPGWKYFKGTAEPSPSGGNPSTDWTKSGFDDSSWLSGSTGIGYGDNDDATVLSDMRNSYRSVYLRRRFDVPDPALLKNFILSVAYDDGFVAYLNGTEVARSRSMSNTGNPPPCTALANSGREASQGPDLFNLNPFLGLLNAGANVLAIQVHNNSIDSSDLSMLPRLVEREILPGSIENSDPNGAWVFRFDPAKHDTSAKTLFDGTQYEINVPAGRTGAAGLADALDVVQGMVNHPSTAEFICIKLIQKFVSDQITLASYKAGTAPANLRALLADAVTAWNSTSPRGNIRKVLEAIFDPVSRSGEFWAEPNYRSKVKTPVEFINSTLRALDGGATGVKLSPLNASMGMSFFTRDDPDGWSELGSRWIDTASLLARINFAQGVAQNEDAGLSWSPATYLSGRGLSTAEEIVDYLGDLMFDGGLSASDRSRLLEFLTTGDAYEPLPLDPASPQYATRIEEFVGFVLSLPQWNFQ